MKFLYMIFLSSFLSGCIYFNDTGVSSHLYDDCKEYYDNCGNYRKICPKNLIDYSQIGSDLTNLTNEQSQCREPDTNTK